MKETIKSLRFYFLLIGITSVLSLTVFLDGVGGVVEQISAAINIIFGIIFIYISGVLKNIIKKKAKLIINVLIATLVYTFVKTAYWVFFTPGGVKLDAWDTLSLIIPVLIIIYLIKNIKRLSDEGLRVSV